MSKFNGELFILIVSFLAWGSYTTIHSCFAIIRIANSVFEFQEPLEFLFHVVKQRSGIFHYLPQRDVVVAS